MVADSWILKIQLEKGRKDSSPSKRQKKTFKQLCRKFFNHFNDLGGGVLRWIKDGFCDDMNNNEDCNYDDGDCCGTLANKKFCVDCQCPSKNFIT